MGLDVDAVYRDAWQIYRLLFRRSVLTAAIVFAFVLAFDQVGAHLNDNGAVAPFIGVLSFVLGLSAPVLVQGALIELVREIHEGRPAKRIRALFERTQRRFWPLLGASILYGFGVPLGFLLLIVPGFLAAARWALMAPFVVLENDGVLEARLRSSDTVRGETSQVLWVVVATFLLLVIPFWLIAFLLPGGAVAKIVVGFAWRSLSAPFDAHVLTVLFYRLTDSEHPVVHDDVFSWPSVWQSA